MTASGSASETMQKILSRIESMRAAEVAVWDKDMTYPMDKAEKSAKRLKKKKAAAAPLLAWADQIDYETPEQIQQRYTRNNQMLARRMIEGANEAAQHAAQFAASVEKLVSPEEFAEINSRREEFLAHWGGHSQMAYETDFWWHKLQQLAPETELRCRQCGEKVLIGNGFYYCECSEIDRHSVDVGYMDYFPYWINESDCTEE